MSMLQLIASGDSFVTRRLPQGGYPGFQEIQALIGEHDVKFSNLEMTFHNQEGTPAAESGGTWAMAAPGCLDDMKAYGFNLYATANNHTGDYGEGGVTATIRHLQERGMIFSGSGRNLEEASRPCYLELSGTRVALVSASGSFAKSSAAGSQSGSLTGRPGLNPLRQTTVYHLTPENYQMVRQLAETTYINAYEDYGIAMGYQEPYPEGRTHFGPFQFVLDQENAVHSDPNAADMERMEKEIREAARQADVVLVSLHVHETGKDNFAAPPEFMEKAARRCIDAGASAVIGHGPHELRGIEKYHGGLIFYSLGNFIFETETVSLQLADAYLKKKLPADTRVGEYMNFRSHNETTGFVTLKKIWTSVLAGWTMEDGRITQARLYPLSLGMGVRRSQRGVPVLSQDDGTLEYLAELSRPYGTDITIRDHVGRIDC